MKFHIFTNVTGQSLHPPSVLRHNFSHFTVWLLMVVVAVATVVTQKQ